MKTLNQFTKELFKDPEVKSEYVRLMPEYDLIRQLIKKRRKNGMTQSDVAKKLGTKQASISRMESGGYGTSLERYARYADALGSKMKITLV